MTIAVDVYLTQKISFKIILTKNFNLIFFVNILRKLNFFQYFLDLIIPLNIQKSNIALQKKVADLQNYKNLQFPIYSHAACDIERKKSECHHKNVRKSLKNYYESHI